MYLNEGHHDKKKDIAVMYIGYLGGMSLGKFKRSCRDLSSFSIKVANKTIYLNKTYFATLVG